MYSYLPPYISERLKTDVLIVGDGIAGLSCALTLAEQGVKPLVVSKGKGNTYLSQGGIAAAVAGDDDPELHLLDTLRAGRLLNDERVARIILSEGVSAIGKLVSWGVEFDKDETFFALALEAAHSRRRILRVKDYTGRAINEALLRRLKTFGVPTLRGELVELYSGGGELLAALLRVGEKFVLVNFKFLVLATGGAAGLYSKTSNRALGAEALGMALRAGAVLRDAEFVQFHPTVLAGTDILISEAVRGEGALLLDERGGRFTDELAPRDVVSRAIYSKLSKGEKVFLDLRPLVRRGIELERRFPQITNALRERGYDPYAEPVPVEPAAHYFIGGLAVDLNSRTTLRRLYAVGECANTGLHGANRLASNSLLEGVVTGIRAAEDIFVRLPFERTTDYVPPKGSTSEKIPPEVPQTLGKLLWEGAGIVRNSEGLKNTLKTLRGWFEKYLPYAFDLRVKAFLDRLLVAEAIVLNALRREESRGCHYREDFPREREVFRGVRFEVSLKDIL